MLGSPFKINGKLIGNRIGSIQRKLILNYSILISLLVLIIVTTNIYITTNIIRENISYYVKQAIRETSNKINVALRNIEVTSDIIVNSRQIQKAVLKCRESNEFQNNRLWRAYQERVELNIILNDLSIPWTDIHSIGIYIDDDHTYFFGRIGDKSLYNMESVERQFPLIDSSPKSMVWIPSYHLNFDTWLFSMARNLVDVDTFKPIGTLVLNIEGRYLNNILNEGRLGSSGSVYLIGREGEIISSKDKKLIGQKLEYPFMERIIRGNEGSFTTNLNGVPVLVAYSTSYYTGWKTVGIAPLNELNSEILSNQAILLIIGILGIILSLILSTMIASGITAPINNIRLAMKKVENGQLEVKLHDQSFIETKELSEGFQNMLRNLRELITKVYEEELRKKEAEFKALQAQINPHFLYNTLETINWMLIIEEKYDLSKMVIYLGDILRYSIEKGNNIITLEKDIEQIEKYLYIQMARFGDKLHYELDISPETLKCKILKLTIQPLIENAINHGIEKKRGQGVIRISSVIQGNKLLVKVEDNGVGMSQEQLNKILCEDGLPAISGVINKHTKLGIKNVDNRIKMYYGSQYGLSIQSEEGRGTCVLVLLPVEREGKENDENTGSR